MLQEILLQQDLNKGLDLLLKDLPNAKAVLFTGQGSFDPYEELFNKKLSIAKRFKVIGSNPKKESIDDMASSYKILENDIVFAVGGGSVMDTAKLVTFCSVNDTKISQASQIDNIKMPILIFLPTTCGTGSESTQFATYYDDNIKKSLDHICLKPKKVLLYPSFLDTLPASVWGQTLADALCQSIESIWNIHSTKQSTQNALRAMEYLIQAIEHHSSEAALLGANLAGQAIQETRTTACHAISYPMTAHFNVPHGQAVFITLPEVLIYNSKTSGKCNDQRGVQFVLSAMQKIYQKLGASNALEAKAKLLANMNTLQLKSKLSDLGIKEKDIELLLDEGTNPNRLGNNPWEMNRSDMKEILMKIL